MEITINGKKWFSEEEIRKAVTKWCDYFEKCSQKDYKVVFNKNYMSYMIMKEILLGEQE